jgi:DNA-binding Lrp family transcriptional regulator
VSGAGDIINDPSDPNAWLQAGLKTAGGAVLGGIGSRALSQLANISAGKAASAIKGLGEKGVSKAIGNVVSEAAPNLGVAGAKALAIADGMPQVGNPLEAPAPQAVGSPDTKAPADVQTTTPDAVAQSYRPIENPTFQNIVLSTLKKDYLEHMRLSGVPWEDFVQQVSEYTNNFDDMSKVAHVLFDDPAKEADFVSGIAKIQALKSINLDEALKPSSVLDAVGIVSGEKAKLKNFMLQLSAANGKSLDSKTQHEVNRFIATLSDQGRVLGNGMDMEQKKKTALAYIEKLGVPIKEFAQMGIV